MPTNNAFQSFEKSNCLWKNDVFDRSHGNSIFWILFYLHLRCPDGSKPRIIRYRPSGYLFIVYGCTCELFYDSEVRVIAVTQQLLLKQSSEMRNRQYFRSEAVLPPPQIRFSFCVGDNQETNFALHMLLYNVGKQKNISSRRVN